MTQASLILNDYAYASSPGTLRIFALNKNDVPTPIFQKGFYPDNFGSYKDRTEFDGHQFASECVDAYHCSYDPLVVYVLRRSAKGDLTFALDLDLSAKKNEERNYPWIGPDFKKSKVVFTPKRTLIEKK